MAQNSSQTDDSVGWNGTSNYIDELKKTVKRFGNRVAIHCEDTCVTYHQLDEWSDRRAAYLRDRGITTGTRVGVWVRRNIETVLNILSVLKAGGIYIPIDPKLPESRLQFIIDDVNIALVLIESDQRSQFSANSQLCLSPETGSRLADSSQNLPVPEAREVVLPSPGLSDLAYILYTSGTTGQPKGVQVTHRSLVQYAFALNQSLHISETDIYLHTASLSFTGSIRQLFLPLVCGATLVMASYEQIMSPLNLAQLIAQHRVTVLDLIPSYLERYLETCLPLDRSSELHTANRSVRMVLCASESLTFFIFKHWNRVFGPQPQLVNMYGQTETIGIASTYHFPEVTEHIAFPLPIGRPISGNRMYVLDEHAVEVPLEQRGEIFVGGNLFAGYTGDSALTEEKVILFRDPNTGTPLRLYRTQDLGYRDAHGTIYHVGRSDDRIKINGFRVDLKEIEQALNRHEAIQKSVVVVKEIHESKHVIAYVLAQASAIPSDSQLKVYLRELLPEYFIPQRIQVLDRFPQSINGKIDRRALRQMNLEEDLNTDTWTAEEQQMRQIWAEVLPVSSVGRHDNFLDLGGNSILGLQVLNRLYDVSQVRLSWTDLFTHPTIHELATLIQTRQHESLLDEDDEPQLIPRASYEV